MKLVVRCALAVLAVLVAIVFGSFFAIWLDGNYDLSRITDAAFEAFGPLGFAMGVAWCASIVVFIVMWSHQASADELSDNVVIALSRLDDALDAYASCLPAQDGQPPGAVPEEEVSPDLVEAVDVSDDAVEDVSVRIPFDPSVEPDLPKTPPYGTQPCCVLPPPGYLPCTRGYHADGPCAMHLAPQPAPRVRRDTQALQPLALPGDGVPE